MKTIPLHPASLLAGLAIGAGFLFLTSQTSTVTFPTARVEVGPHPRDMVQIHDGQPFTVPPGKLFVLTGLGNTTQGPVAVLRVNGQIEVKTDTSLSGFGACYVAAVPSGFSVPSGASISVETVGPSLGYARAWGYLAER